MKKISLDVGDARIGIARTDASGRMAFAGTTYVRKNNEEDFKFLAKYCTEENAELIVIGMPYNMDGTEGARAEKTREFAKKLEEHTKTRIVFYDERLTTVEAERILKETGVKREKRKMVVDKIAAAVILQNYIDENQK